MGLKETLVVVSLAAASTLATGQVTFNGTYEREIRVTLQVDTLDPRVEPPAPVLGFQDIDVLFEIGTEVVLSETPSIGNTGVDVLSFRMTQLRVTFLDDPDLDVPFFPPEDLLFNFDGEDLAINFRDLGDAEQDFFADAPGSAVIEYDAMDAASLGSMTLSSPLFKPFTIDVSIFNPFVAQLPEFNYDLKEENGEVVQEVSLPFIFNFFGADVVGSEFGISFFPTFGGDFFEFASPLEAACQPQPAGTFDEAARFARTGFAIQGLDIADVNGDGLPDAVVVLNTFEPTDALTTVLNLGGGVFEDFAFPESAPADSRATGLGTADFDGDGITDAAVTGTDDDGLEIFFGNGDGTFTLAQKILETTSFATTLTVGDVNGDNAPDVVITSSLDDDADFFVNDGTGQFALEDTIPAGDSIRQTLLVDLDGDGDNDFVTVSAFDDLVNLFTNDGSGTMTPAGSLPAADEPIGIAAADVDGDGDADIASISLRGDTVALYRNDGSGSFGPAETLLLVDEPLSIVFEDLDNDSDPDLLIALGADDAVAILTNDGSGGFSAPVLTPEADNVGVLRTGDFDNDGDPDIMSPQFVFGDFDRLGLNVFFNACTAEGPAGCNPADLDAPFGLLDLADVTTFVTAFTTSDPIADIDGSGLLDLADVVAFVTAFNAGCP